MARYFRPLLGWGAILTGVAYGIGEIYEIRMEPGGTGGLISLPPGLRPGPGQYMLASSAGGEEGLPVVIYPAGWQDGRLAAAPPLPPAWQAGTRLHLRGPLGKGFHLPPGASRVALAALGSTHGRLMPLAERALQAGAALVLYADFIPPNLPASIEVLPLDSLADGRVWADYLAVDAPLGDLPRLPALLGLGFHQRPACQVEVLVITAMPCGGSAVCGACALRRGSRWLQVCKDGPVFPYDQILSRE